MPTARFTKDVVEKLIKVKAHVLTCDAQHPGFALRTYKSGAPAVWRVKYSAGACSGAWCWAVASWGNMEVMRDLAEVTRAKAKMGHDTLAVDRAARGRARGRSAISSNRTSRSA